MAKIDLDKLDSAYDFLAETQEGHEALRKFRAALDALQKSIGNELTWPEFLFVARSLVQQLKMDEPAGTDALRDVSSENLESLKGYVFQDQPGAVTRLGSNLSSPALSRLLPGNFMINTQK